ncbi:Clp protease N-terminal domain-containing protein [Spongisporangium articulatum]|uniref:Clp protease N-terminal domain-containing protein n=1 Tax=Spongisporangium articulatum TaxID=3362603 RepID=A0ABW8ANV7_9ACTN
MLERFTSGAREAVVGARQAATDQQRPVGTEHLLLALTADPGPGGTAVREFAPGLDAAAVRAAIERLVPSPRPLLDAQDAEALRSVGIDLDAVLARIEETFGPAALERPKPRRGWFRRTPVEPPVGRFVPRAKKVLELALREALRLGDGEIGSGHLLLGLLREGEGLGVRILVDAGVDLAALRQACEERLGHGRAA